MRGNTAFALCLMGVLLVLAPRARGQWPYPTPDGQVRLMAWNIEFLNTRSPPRTAQQLDLLAQRIAGFDAWVMALQEISQHSVLQDLATNVGPTWRIVVGASGQQEVLLYDESKLTLVSGGTLGNLSSPPYTPYPAPWERTPASGVFVPAGGGDPFRVISVHCDSFRSTIREAEGQWLHEKVLEFLDTPGEPEDIFVLGDYNGGQGSPPHPTLLQSGTLRFLPKENWMGGTAVLNWGVDIDHCSATQGALDRLPKPSVFVVRCGDYGETPYEFEAAYSDHYPIVVDLNVPEPAALSLLALGVLGLRRRLRA